MKVKEILELIVNLTINSSKSEENKQQLNDHPDFEPYALFSRIDRNDKSYITKNDLLNFLQDNNISINENRCTVDLFIEYYDRDFDEKLNFGEFLNFVLNKDQNLIRSIATQRETYKLNNNEFLNKDLEELASKCLMSDFYLFEYANVKKIDIFNHIDDNNQSFLLELFINMDIDKDGLISCDDISVFLQDRKIQICDEELISFISIYDEDLDGMLNWNEFLFFILPSPINYEYDLSELKQLEGKYLEYYQMKKNNFNNNNYNYNYNCNNNYSNYKDYNSNNCYNNIISSMPLNSNNFNYINNNNFGINDPIHNFNNYNCNNKDFYP
jgi:Ca2+-binding EF-hand superfamily protein